METLTLGTMQFTAVVLMALLTFKLMVPHKRSQETAVATMVSTRARPWFFG